MPPDIISDQERPLISIGEPLRFDDEGTLLEEPSPSPTETHVGCGVLGWLGLVFTIEAALFAGWLGLLPAPLAVFVALITFGVALPVVVIANRGSKR